MSTTTRKPFLSDEDIETYADEWNKGERGITIAHRTSLVQGADWVRDKYEAHLAEMEQTIADLRARVEALQKAGPKFDLQGIGFGHFWISYDAIVGWRGDPGPERDLFWRHDIGAKALLKWLNENRSEEITPTPTDHE